MKPLRNKLQPTRDLEQSIAFLYEELNRTNEAVNRSMGFGQTDRQGEVGDLRTIKNDAEDTLNLTGKGDYGWYITPNDLMQPLGKGGQWLKRLRFDNRAYLGSVNNSNLNDWQLGKGWRIEETSGDVNNPIYHMYINDLTINGTLRAWELLLQQVRASKGDIIISPGNGKVKSISDASVGDEYVEIEDPETEDIVSFVVGDIVLCQRVEWNGRSQTVTKRYVRRIAQVGGNYVRLEGGVTGAPADTNSVEIGDELVVIGNDTDDTRDGSIYISTTQSNSPFIRVLDGVTNYSEFTSESSIVAQLGNLGGLTYFDGNSIADNTYGLKVVDNILIGKSSSGTGIELTTDDGKSITTGFAVWDSANPKMFLGDADNYVKWNVTAGKLEVKGEIIVTNPGDIGNVTIRSNSEPATRTDGSDLVAGDFWIDTDNSDKLYTWDGNSWEESLPQWGDIVGLPGYLDNVSVAGLYLNANFLGYYDGTSPYNASGWKTYMDNTGKFYLGGTSGKLQWDGANLAIEGSVTITGGSGIANLTDAGGLATQDSVDWDSDVDNRPGGLLAPSGNGLYLSSTHMGYYESGAFKTYIKNDGTFYFAGDGSNYIYWNGATLDIRGDLNASDINAGTVSANYLEIGNRPFLNPFGTTKQIDTTNDWTSGGTGYSANYGADYVQIKVSSGNGGIITKSYWLRDERPYIDAEIEIVTATTNIVVGFRETNNYAISHAQNYGGISLNNGHIYALENTATSASLGTFVAGDIIKIRVIATTSGFEYIISKNGARSIVGEYGNETSSTSSRELYGSILTADTSYKAKIYYFHINGSEQGVVIDGGSIYANSITADKITAGEIITGGVKSSATMTYARGVAGTEAGYFLGEETTDKLFIGSSASKYLGYDGNDLTLVGGTITGGTIQTATSGSRIVLDDTDPSLIFYVNNGSSDKKIVSFVPAYDDSGVTNLYQLDLITDVHGSDTKYITFEVEEDSPSFYQYLHLRKGTELVFHNTANTAFAKMSCSGTNTIAVDNTLTASYLGVFQRIYNQDIIYPKITEGGTDSNRTLTVQLSQLNGTTNVSTSGLISFWISTSSDPQASDPGKSTYTLNNFSETTGRLIDPTSFSYTALHHGITTTGGAFVITATGHATGIIRTLYFHCEIQGVVYTEEFTLRESAPA